MATLKTNSTIKKVKNEVIPDKNSVMPDFFDVQRFLIDDFFTREWAHAIHISETENSFIIKLPVPGFCVDKFKVDVENGILSITAERKVEEERKRHNYTHRRFNYDSFSHSFRLPKNADEQDIDMSYDNTILILTMAKKQVNNSHEKEGIVKKLKS